ncbi:hypothetical protein ACFYZ2_31475 [Streptomyces sviceus]|uniref:hypothetical protein n=1 Tax=Streptomyces sviceus TaxID=285530 RepID=UPI0036A63302
MRHRILSDRTVSAIGPGADLASTRFSPAFRFSRRELEHCTKLDLAFLPQRPLDGCERAGLAERPRAIQQAADETGTKVTSVHRVTPAREPALALAPVAAPARPAPSHSERVT